MENTHKRFIAKENNKGNIKPLLSYKQVKQLLTYLEKNKDFDIKQLEKVYYSLIELKYIPRGFY
jgi:Mg2+/Co2+ transporter CorC